MSQRREEHIHALSGLVLAPDSSQDAIAYVSALDGEDRDIFLRTADSHHVVLRALSTLQRALPPNAVLQGWISTSIHKEQERIANALVHLGEVCNQLESAGFEFVVMKSLDHWPDLGNDLDLYSSANENQIISVFEQKLHAKIEGRSWGDRLAKKWNFSISGLPESVEVHTQRLGQTGEHIAMARQLIRRKVDRQIAGYTFPVPAPEERVIVATLQRLYRHFYFRVCDIANTAALVESNQIDYVQLEQSANLGGIWPGVCTYLTVVSDYFKKYRGVGLVLPANVRANAAFGGDKVQARGLFIRVPIMPEGASLYTRQVTATAMRGDVPATLRLSLLPYLASAAAVAYRITGSDKGIW